MIHNTVKKQCGLNLAVAILVIAMPASTQAQTPQHMAPSPPQGLAVEGGGAAAVRPAATAAGAVDEEFVGPFPSWKNVKDYGAKGDGTTDDSSAIQAALNDLKTVITNAYSVLYFPAGTYRITKTLVTTRVITTTIWAFRSSEKIRRTPRSFGMEPQTR